MADLRVAERIFAPHYAVASTRTATVRQPLLATPGGTPLSEVLQGEDFEILEISAGHAWGMSPVDGAVGFVAVDSLDAPRPATHAVCAVEANGLPMGSRLTDTAGFDPAAVIALDAPVADFVILAEALVGVPERIGGRSGAGVDGAGLVFLTLSLAGIRAPRFADLQAATLGHPVDADAPVLRGDLIHVAGHVAIAVDGDTVIHVADGAVARAPLATVQDEERGTTVTRRRLP